jgi:hypothetical protein
MARKRGRTMSYLQVPDALLESNAFFALSPTAKSILWLACRKHMKFWTAKKAMVIFGLSKTEIMSLGIGHNLVAPALRELTAAGLVVLIQKGYGGDGVKNGVVSQYRLAFLDEDRKHVFAEPHTVDEWKEILHKAKVCKEKSKTPKRGLLQASEQGPKTGPLRGQKAKTPKQGLFCIYGHYHSRAQAVVMRAETGRRQPSPAAATTA